MVAVSTTLSGYFTSLPGCCLPGRFALLGVAHHGCCRTTRSLVIGSGLLRYAFFAPAPRGGHSTSALPPPGGPIDGSEAVSSGGGRVNIRRHAAFPLEHRFFRMSNLFPARECSSIVFLHFRRCSSRPCNFFSYSLVVYILFFFIFLFYPLSYLLSYPLSFYLLFFYLFIFFLLITSLFIFSLFTFFFNLCFYIFFLFILFFILCFYIFFLFILFFFPSLRNLT
jgi:hypothetical protein